MTQSELNGFTHPVFNFDAEYIKNFLDSAQRRIPLTTLNILDRGHTDLRHLSQILLSQRKHLAPPFHQIFQLHSLICYTFLQK